MNIFHAHYHYLKESASILLKQCLDGNNDAVERFHRLAPFAGLSKENNNLLETLQLKDAFSLLALESGYASWNELKSALDHAAETSSLAEISDQFYPKGFTTYWNIWFAKYSQAKKVLVEALSTKKKMFLLPFKNQFFLVEEHFVDSIGIPHTLPEWKTIGNDWVHPNHVKAWLVLNEKYEKAAANRK
ncbi:MAG: hypothetical protein H3C35_04535 [Bacteroidetes bacterium]|nr:hypothetical protein [Bacteroidota bacterium]